MLNLRRSILFAAFLVVTMTGPGIAARQQISAAPSSKSELEGTWAGVYSATEGKTRDLKPGEVKMTFQGPKLLAIGVTAHEQRELTYTLDSKASPKRLDFKDPKNQMEGACIYEVSGDTLKIAVPSSTSSNIAQ